MSDTEENEKTIAEDLVVTKYKMVGDIVNRVLKEVLTKCVVGASVRDVCIYGDELLVVETNKVFKREKSMKKGIASPTCISVNNCIHNFSPLNNEEDYVLREEDILKVALGAHVDGFVAVVAHTLVLGASETNKIMGRKADVVMAAHYASQVALRLLKSVNEPDLITEAVQKISDAYHCKPIEGTLSPQLKQFSIDGGKAIVQNPNEDKKKEQDKFEFETFEVYAINVTVSTGEGVGREMDTRTSIFKKTDNSYQLKSKTSRKFYSEVIHKYGTMLFNLRNFEDVKTARLALTECMKHDVVQPRQVLYEKPNEFVAQFKFTVLLMPNGPHKITGLPFNQDIYMSSYSISDPQIKSILNASANPKAYRRKKKNVHKVVKEFLTEND